MSSRLEDEGAGQGHERGGASYWRHYEEKYGQLGIKPRADHGVLLQSINSITQDEQDGVAGKQFASGEVYSRIVEHDEHLLEAAITEAEEQLVSDKTVERSPQTAATEAEVQLISDKTVRSSPLTAATEAQALFISDKTVERSPLTAATEAQAQFISDKTVGSWPQTATACSKEGQFASNEVRAENINSNKPHNDSGSIKEKAPFVLEKDLELMTPLALPSIKVNTSHLKTAYPKDETSLRIDESKSHNSSTVRDGDIKFMRREGSEDLIGKSCSFDDDNEVKSSNEKQSSKLCLSDSWPLSSATNELTKVQNLSSETSDVESALNCSLNMPLQTKTELTQNIKAKVSRGHPRRFHSDLGFSTVANSSNSTIPTPRMVAVLNNSTLRRHLAKIMGVEQTALTVDDFQGDLRLRQSAEFLQRKSKLRATMSDVGLRVSGSGDESNKIVPVHIDRKKGGCGSDASSQENKENTCALADSGKETLTSSFKLAQVDFDTPAKSSGHSYVSPSSGSVRGHLLIPSFQEFKRMRRSKTVSPRDMFQAIVEDREPEDVENSGVNFTLRKTQSTGHLQSKGRDTVVLQSAVNDRNSGSPDLKSQERITCKILSKEQSIRGIVDEKADTSALPENSGQHVDESGSAKNVKPPLRQYDQRAKTLHRSNAIRPWVRRANSEAVGISDLVYDCDIHESNLDVKHNPSGVEIDDDLTSQYSEDQKVSKDDEKSSHNKNDRLSQRGKYTVGATSLDFEIGQSDLERELCQSDPDEEVGQLCPNHLNDTLHKEGGHCDPDKVCQSDSLKEVDRCDPDKVCKRDPLKEEGRCDLDLEQEVFQSDQNKEIGRSEAAMKVCTDGNYSENEKKGSQETQVQEKTLRNKPPRPRSTSTPSRGHHKVKEKRANKKSEENDRTAPGNLSRGHRIVSTEADDVCEDGLQTSEDSCTRTDIRNDGIHRDAAAETDTTDNTVSAKSSLAYSGGVTEQHCRTSEIEDRCYGDGSGHMTDLLRSDESLIKEAGGPECPGESSSRISGSTSLDCLKPIHSLPPPHPLSVKPDKLTVTRSTSDVTDLKAEEQRKKPSKSRRVRAYRSDPFSLTARKANQESSKLENRTLSCDTASSEDILMITQVGQRVSSSSVLSSRSQTSLDSSFEEEDDYSSELLGEFSRSASKKSFCRGRKRKECGSCSEVERVDSGVGAELRVSHNQEHFCEDCEVETENFGDDVPLCQRCARRRRERKAAIEELISTEENYGNDLLIMKQEFVEPMCKIGLLTAYDCERIFSNLDELILINSQFRTTLDSAVQTSHSEDDKEYCKMCLGQLFLASSNMLLAFETYCVNQSYAVSVLETLEREKHLFRVYLLESQNQNCLLKRRDLKSFLMVPIQRVMKYPLLLNRISKGTPHHHDDRKFLKEAQEKVRIILDIINSRTKEKSSTASVRKIFPDLLRSGSCNYLDEVLEIQKTGIEILGWYKNLVKVVLAGRLLCAQPADHLWMRKLRSIKYSSVCVLLATLEKNNQDEQTSKSHDAFKSHDQFQAALVLMKEKHGALYPLRHPLYLSQCIIHMDSDCSDVFEVSEMPKETYLFKSEKGPEDTLNWQSCIRCYTRKLGKWRKRRGGLPNIIINSFD